MAYEAADWSITRATKIIDYIGDDHGGASPSYARVIEAHRAWGALADDEVSAGDDELAISDLIPSARTTDNFIRLLNGYSLTDAALEHLYDGTITWDNGNERADGFVNFGNADVQIQIIQNGAVLSDDFWNQAGAGLNPDAAQGISHRFMLKTRTGGADIDGRRVIGTNRRINKSFGEFVVNGTLEGNNTLALKDADDLNNETLEATIATWTDVVLTEGYTGIDVDNNGANEFYAGSWDRGSRSINEFFERLKWIQRDGSAETIYGLSGELFRGITHEIDIDNPAGTFVEPEAVSWTGGTGQLLAIDSTTAGTKMWIQLLTGVAPSDNDEITGGTSSATADTNGAPTERTIQTPYVGLSTGTSIVGSYGLGVEATDLSSADKVFDLTNTQVTPPNFVTFTVSGLVAGEDRVLVGPWDGVSLDPEGNPAFDFDQFTVATALTGAAETAVQVNAAIPADTPNSGTIRVFTNSGEPIRVPYTSYTGDTFTIPATDFSGDNADVGNNTYISYIDVLAGATTETFTGVYVADRNLVVKVLDGGVTPIQQFISGATLGNAGGSASVIRNSDA